MPSHLRTRLDQDSDGFSLVELLVVVVIIGILAAIAIPIFLAQKRRGYDVSVKSDLRDFATLEEAYLTSNTVYADYSQLLPEYKPTAGVSLTLENGAGTAGTFCVSGVHSGSGHVWFYDSKAGGIQPATTTACS